MTLEEYVVQKKVDLLASLDQFAKLWKDGSNREPDNYPYTLADIEAWNRQFDCYCELGEG